VIFFLPLSVFGEKKTRDRRDQRLEWIFRAQGKHRGGGGKTEGRGASRNPHPGEVTDEDSGGSLAARKVTRWKKKKKKKNLERDQTI